MKFLLLTALLLLVSCNPRKKVVVENDFDNSNNESRLDDLELRVAALEAKVAINISQISVNSGNISVLQYQLSQEVINLQSDIADLNSELSQLLADSSDNSEAISATQEALSDLQSQLNDAISLGGQAYTNILNQISTINTTNGNLQNSVDTLITQMAQLQLQETVIGLVDPCPLVISNDYKEHFLKMKSGKLVAYFESGSNRFLSVLTAGSYRTTDSRACNFSVDANNNIVVSSAPSVPVGSTHKLLLCNVVAYKVGSTISFNGTAYSSSFSSGGCSVTINNSANNVSSNGGSVAGTTVCNYNNISSVTGTQYNSGASSSGCYVTKL